MSPKIFMIGMYHLGCVNTACLSSFGYEITCFDFDKEVINNLSKGIFPIKEDGVPEYFKKQSNRIHYSKNIKDVEKNDFIFITYDIEANGIKIDIIDKIIEKLKPYIKNQIIVVRSQVPVGTCDKIKEQLNTEVCYVPENLQLGKSIRNFLFPVWMVFGLSSDDIKKQVVDLFNNVSGIKMFMNLKEAEMTKLAMNCYLATLISFSGEISDICEKMNINAKQILSALRLDKRVGQFSPIIPGLGFSGGTIERDLYTIIKNNQTSVLDAVYWYNKKRGWYILNKLEELLGDLKNKKITFFGATYKSGTDTLRDSPTVTIIERLRKHTSNIKVYDPLVKEGIKGAHFITPEEAVGSDAIVIMTDYDEFKNLNYYKLKPKVIIDTKGILPKKIKHYEIGVPYGKSSNHHGR